MEIDHVVLLAPDAAAAAEELREQHGLGWERGQYQPFAGTRAYTIPLAPPAYIEILEIEDRAAAQASSKGGRDALACEAAGYGLLAWAVRVDDLEAVSLRVDREIFDYTIPHGDGTLRGWRSVSRRDTEWRSAIPFFIDYPNNGDRLGRWQAIHDRVGHACVPGEFSELTISGSEDELTSWLGPHELPLRFTSGSAGLVEARAATDAGEVVLSRVANPSRKGAA
ncbi:MAG TPA: VOC family protein [Gaiellaceae bacterium]